MTMTTFPLVAHDSPDAIVAWRHGHAVTVRRFLADVATAAAQLPPGGHVFNVCIDRYQFAVGLCAAVVSGKVSLLPPSQNPEMVRQLAAFAPDTFCLHDGEHGDIDLPGVRLPEPRCGSHGALGADTIPAIPADRTIAYVFTSGSTGRPVPHRKTWGAMVGNARAATARLGLAGIGACTLVGTVPPQHMYGFECTVLLALQGGVALSADHPFYPADFATALDRVPPPRVLVTSPVHLRALALSGLDMPPVALVLSASAPLDRALARDMERRLGAPLTEIYGSTETGHIATRRTAQASAWALLPGVRLQRCRDDGDEAPDEARASAAANEDEDDGEHYLACGAHLAEPVAVHDAIEQLDARRFLLHGRKADLVKIAGKRTSLAYLNHHLHAIPGVLDGVFYLPANADAAADGARDARGRRGRVTRLIVVVVAPTLSAAGVLRALRRRLDAAFLPRRVLFVDALPRNSAGKLPRARLDALVAAELVAGQLEASTV